VETLVTTSGVVGAVVIEAVAADREEAEAGSPVEEGAWAKKNDTGTVDTEVVAEL